MASLAGGSPLLLLRSIRPLLLPSLGSRTPSSLPLSPSPRSPGLVSITSACSVVEPWAAILIGAIGAVWYTMGARLCLQMKIDDCVNATAVHYFAGIWGLLAPGLFAKEANMMTAYVTSHCHQPSSPVLPCSQCSQSSSHSSSQPPSLPPSRTPSPRYGMSGVEGFLYSGKLNMMGAQITGVAAVTGWVCANMCPFFVILNCLGIFRVSKEVEVRCDARSCAPSVKRVLSLLIPLLSLLFSRPSSNPTHFTSPHSTSPLLTPLLLASPYVPRRRSAWTSRSTAAVRTI